MSEYKVHRVRFINPLSKPINSAAVDTVKHNPKLALSREDGSIEIRDPCNQFILESIIPGQDGRTVEHLAWNSGRLFSGGLNGEIIEWDLECLKPKHSEDSLGGPVWCLHFNHEKDLLAAGCEDGSIRIFKVLNQGLFYEKSLHKQEKRVLSLAWSRDDSKIVAGGFDSTIRIYDVATGSITSRLTTSSDSKSSKKSSTMVWAIEILKDFTIVTGDSLGNTQFWDGHTGTLITSFQSHKADVLTLAVCESEKMVYSSGVDCQIVQFKLANKGNDVQQWTITGNVRPTEYDIRTLVISRGFLIAAGVDPSFMVYPLDKFRWNYLTRYASLTPTDACQLACNANQVLCRYQHKINLWQLEDSELIHVNKCQKLLEVTSESDDHLVSSAISSCGKYLCYSTVSKAKFYAIQSSPMQLKKIFLQVPPLLKIMFTPDSRFMVGATFNKALHLVDLKNENSFDIDIGDCNVRFPIRLLKTSANSKYLCFVDSALPSSSFIYKIVENGLKFITTIPKVDSTISSISFHPETNNVFLATTFKKVYEFDFKEEKFAPWLLELNGAESFNNLGKEHHVIREIVFNPLSTNEVFIQCESQFGKVIYGSRAEEDCPPKKKKKMTKKTKLVDGGKGSLKLNSAFRMVFHFSFNSKGELVIAEKPKGNAGLPKPLKVKKFQHK